jgi:hypothetical protein
MHVSTCVVRMCVVHAMIGMCGVCTCIVRAVVSAGVVCIQHM